VGARPVKTPQSLSFVFTKALPVGDFSIHIVQKDETLPTATPTILPFIPTPGVSGASVPFEDIYKQAGAKFSVPWQILYGIHMTETGGRDGTIYNSQGSGAQGPMQFMPGTWRGYGVDGNGDGVADINNAVDAIYGAANYLAKHSSLENGLASYGGNIAGILAIAHSQGYTQ